MLTIVKRLPRPPQRLATGTSGRRHGLLGGIARIAAGGTLSDRGVAIALVDRLLYFLFPMFGIAEG